ncbi:MAG: hypothetical protein R3B96_05660 [Pirellulaceae bacterium]
MLALDLDGNPDSLKTIHRIQAALDHLRGLYEQVRGYCSSHPNCSDRGPSWARW